MTDSLVSSYIFFCKTVKTQKPTAAKLNEIEAHLTGCPLKFKVKTVTIQKRFQAGVLKYQHWQMNASNRYIGDKHDGIIIKTGSSNVYHSVYINSRCSYLRRYKMGDNNCSINALSITTSITITTSFRGVVLFANTDALRERCSNCVSAFKGFCKPNYFFPNISDQSLWRNF